MSKLVNRLKLLKDFYLKKTHVSGLPLELVIEVTNQCNLKCVMCIRKQMKRSIGLMKFKLYKKIIDEAAMFMELVYLHGLGEPLFHPKIFEMVKYAKSKNLRVCISTNAVLLTSDKAKKLIESGLDYLIIAVDAVTSKTYKKVRGVDSFNEVSLNIKEYMKLKKRANSPPFTVVQFVKVKENEKEANKFQKIWQNSGADVVRIKPAIDLLRQKRVNKFPKRPCFYIWRQLNMISWDGKIVTPCCMDANGDYCLGDINKNSIQEIWNSPAMVALRDSHVSSKWKNIQLCANCLYPQPSLLGKLGAMLVSDMKVKKILPSVEKISLGRFHFYG